MEGKEAAFFKELKQAVQKTFQKRFPEYSDSIVNWKRAEIEHFQKDLNDTVQGQVSERWFYDHMKSENQKLPRIDILDLLCKYAGFENWAQFKKEHEKIVLNQEDKRGSGNKHIIKIVIYGLMGVGLIMILSLFVISWFFVEEPAPLQSNMNEQIDYRFCIVDAISMEKISGSKVVVLYEDQKESPKILQRKEDENGCFVTKGTQGGQVQIAISAPYYISDTIFRTISLSETGNSEADLLSLKSDDYALMLHYFSKEKVKDWKKRKAQLDQILSDEVMVYQVHGDEKFGMDMMNKTEFINKLTMPVPSLNAIRILETQYENGKIRFIRFTQKDE